MKELRIVGPQFSDPHLFVQWLAEGFKVNPAVHLVGPHDRYLELSLPSGVHVLSTAPPHWDLQRVYDRVFPHAHAILLMINRIHDFRRLNAEVVEFARENYLRIGVKPIVAANDPHGGNPSFPAVSAAEAREDVDPSWPLFETTIGPFESPLRWSKGAAEVWDRLLVEAQGTTA